jgi:hypothetical protein
MDELDRCRGAGRAIAGIRPGTEEDQHRPQALATGRQGRRCLGREPVVAVTDDLTEP